MKTPRPTTLRGQKVTLVPLSQDQASEYFAIGQDADVWQFLAPDPFKISTDAEHWIESMLCRQQDSGSVTFSVYDNGSGKLAGSSSFLDVRTAHEGLEIGYTWYGHAFRRTYVNTATKLVLLEHAFDELGAIRVQLQTDARNQRSQKAIERIGAVKRRSPAISQNLSRWIHPGLRALQHYPQGMARSEPAIKKIGNNQTAMQTNTATSAKSEPIKSINGLLCYFVIPPC